MNIAEIREKYPQYDHLSDGALIHGFWNKSYKDKDIPMGQFADRVGLSSEGFKEMVELAKQSGYEPTTSSGPEGPGNEVITGFSQQDQSFVDPDADLTPGGVVSTYAHGLGFGFSDEILGHMGAITESLGGSDLSYDELYTRFKDFEESRVQDYWDKSPGKAFGAEVAGAITTTALTRGTAPMLLLKSPKFLMDLSKGWKAFLASTGYGGVYGAGTGEQGERGENALKVGALSGMGGFVLNKFGTGIYNKYDKWFKKANQSPTIENLKKLKNEAYDKAKDLGIKFHGTIVEKFKNIGIKSLDEGYDPEVEKITASSVTLFEKVLDRAYLKGATFEQLDLLQRQLWSKLNQSGGKEVKIYKLINAVGDLIKSHPDQAAESFAAKQANAVYNKAKMLDIEFKKVLNNTEISGNLGQKYRMAVRGILNSKRLSKFLEPEDITQLQSFLKKNITDKALKGIGAFSPGGSGVMNWINLLAVFTNPAMIIATATAASSKHYFNKRTVKGAEKLMNYMKQFKPKEPNIPVAPVSAVGSGNINVAEIREKFNQ